MNEMYNDDFEDETYDPEATGKEFVKQLTDDNDAKEHYETNIIEHPPANSNGDNVNENEHVENKWNESKKKEAIVEHNKSLSDLDYEDIIAGMPTRFRYHTVEKDSYGLSTEEILKADDSLLGQFVPLKKIAPYRDLKWMASGKARRKFRVAYRESLSKKNHADGINMKEKKETSEK